ncbi:MAG TPA: BREX system ATP-binding domain-containing protein [Gammaproteobacteria bacterium]|nr:BREX system ATP-binding domain-containing protein [Gammaproteobacteria bacterium]
MTNRPPIEARGAIEALRAGVPNRAAIRQLGEKDGGLVNSFLDSLSGCTKLLEQGRQAEGTLVWGGFGAGKSHLLGFMRELALERNFVVSLVPVSKETPMFDPARLFAAAIRAAEVPGVNDDVMTGALAIEAGDRALRSP